MQKHSFTFTDTIYFCEFIQSISAVPISGKH